MAICTGFTLQYMRNDVVVGPRKSCNLFRCRLALLIFIIQKCHQPEPSLRLQPVWLLTIHIVILSIVITDLASVELEPSC